MNKQEFPDPLKSTQKATKDITATKSKRSYQALIFQSYLIITIVSFTILSIFAHNFPYFKIDLIISTSFQSFNPPGFMQFMQFISFWGYYPQMFIITSLILFFLFTVGFKWEAILGLLSGLGAVLLTGVLKTLIGRSRPPTDLVNVVNNLQDKSFPSGHVLTYTAFIGYLWFLSFILLKPSIIRTILLIIFGSLVILVGPSRVYLGEHWPSDTLGAYLVGSIWLLITIYTYRWGKKRLFVSVLEARQKK